MFNYQRKVLESKLEQLSEKFQQKGQEHSEYQNESYHIGSYLEQKQFILKHQFVAGLSCIIGSVCLAFSFLSNITCLMYAFMAFGLTGYEIVNIPKNKKRIQQDYSDLCNVDYDLLVSKLHSVNEKLYGLSKEKYEIYDEICSCTAQLKELQHYEEASAFLTSQEGILLSADTEAEYHALQHMKTESSNIFQDYLDEKVDYSQIHFDNSIGQQIENSENSKILMKKM